MTTRVFGQLPDGRDVRLLVIGSAPGPVVEVLQLGTTVHRLEVTGGDEVRRNVVHLDGRDVQVGAHDRGNSLHGEPDGFDVCLWEVVELGADEVVLSLTSPREGNGATALTPARPAHSPTPALRTSHFPDPPNGVKASHARAVGKLAEASRGCR